MRLLEGSIHFIVVEEAARTEIAVEETCAILVLRIGHDPVNHLLLHPHNLGRLLLPHSHSRVLGGGAAAAAAASVSMNLLAAISRQRDRS